MDTTTKVKLAISAFGAIVGGLTLVYGVVRHYDDERRQITLEQEKFKHARDLEDDRFKHDQKVKDQEYQQREDEVNRTFWDNRTAKCIEVTSLTGRIVAERTFNQDTVKAFLAMYYGPLSIFENQYIASKETSLETAMVRFKFALEKCLKDRKSCDWDSQDPLSLGHASVLVAHACTCLICSGFTDNKSKDRIPECATSCPRSNAVPSDSVDGGAIGEDGGPSG